MPMYLVPELPQGSQCENLLLAAGVRIVRTERLYELIQALPQQDEIVVATLSMDDLILMVRNMSTLLPVLTPAIINAPDVPYHGKWMTIANTLGIIDWLEFEHKIVKTGLLANSTEEAEQRVALQSKETRREDPLEAPQAVLNRNRFTKDQKASTVEVVADDSAA